MTDDMCDFWEIRDDIIFCRHPDNLADPKVWGPAFCFLCAVPKNKRRDEAKHTGHERDYD